MEQALHYAHLIYSQIPWQTVGATIAASGMLVPIMDTVIRWFNTQKDVVKIAMVYLGGCIVAGIHYLLNMPTADPSVIAMQGAVVAFLSSSFYQGVYKDSIKGVLKSKIAEAKARNLVQHSAVIPSTGLPLTSDTDFSQ